MLNILRDIYVVCLIAGNRTFSEMTDFSYCSEVVNNILIMFSLL